MSEVCVLKDRNIDGGKMSEILTNSDSVWSEDAGDEIRAPLRLQLQRQWDMVTKEIP